MREKIIDPVEQAAFKAAGLDKKPEKPVKMLQTATMAKKEKPANPFLTTQNTAREQLEVELQPAKPGPKTGQDYAATLRFAPDYVEAQKALPDFSYCVKFAVSSEWARFRKEIEARVSKEPAFVWEKCDNPRCGIVFKRRYRDKPGTSCFHCNFANYKDGGMMKPMSQKEVKQYLADEAKREAELRERDFRAAMKAENLDREKHGLPPWTLGQYQDVRAERAILIRQQEARLKANLKARAEATK